LQHQIFARARLLVFLDIKDGLKKDTNLAQLSPATTLESLLAVLKSNRIIRKRTDANCSNFHLRVFLGLSNPRDRDRLTLYLYRVITLVKEKLNLT
jgi:hypothetical protein